MGETDITCREFIRTLAGYLAGELRGDDRMRSDLHLGVCPDCVRYLENYEVTIRLGRESIGDEASPGNETALPEGLAQVILSARRKT